MVKQKRYSVFFQWIVFHINCCKIVTNFLSKIVFLSKIRLGAENCWWSGRSWPVVLLYHVYNELVSLRSHSTERYFKYSNNVTGVLYTTTQINREVYICKIPIVCICAVNCVQSPTGLSHYWILGGQEAWTFVCPLYNQQH